MFDPTKASDGYAILDAQNLVRHFLFEGNLDHLLEIARALGATEAAVLAESMSKMGDGEIRAWSTWLSQLEPVEAARILRTYVL